MLVTVNTLDSSISAGEWLSFAGTLIVAIVAIWSQPLRAFFIRPRLAIAKHNFEGEPTHDTVSYLVYYHLKMVNERKWLPVKRCRVSLTGYSRKTSTGEFRDMNMAVPFQFVWSPADKFRAISITNEKVFDFVRLNSSERIIEPVLYETPYSFAGRISEGGAARYKIEFTCQNSYGNCTKIFEVGLEKGEWTKDPWEARSYVRIKEVSSLVD